MYSNRSFIQSQSVVVLRWLLVLLNSGARALCVPSQTTLRVLVGLLPSRDVLIASMDEYFKSNPTLNASYVMYSGIPTSSQELSNYYTGADGAFDVNMVNAQSGDWDLYFPFLQYFSVGTMHLYHARGYWWAWVHGHLQLHPNPPTAQAAAAAVVYLS